MAEKKTYVIEGGVAKGKLKRGFQIGETKHLDFELREYTVADLIDAEAETHVTQVIAFNAQLMVRQLIRIGDFKGPFTVGQIKTLAPVDWRILRAAQMGLESLGEDEPSDSESSSTESR